MIIPSPLVGEGKDGAMGLRTINARQLRNSPTQAEIALWERVHYRQINGYKFRRQQPIGRYIVDFVCLEKKLIVELDGNSHLNNRANDDERTKEIQVQGYKVIRFWNSQVLHQIETVLASILLELEASPHLNPPQRVGRK